MFVLETIPTMNMNLNRFMELHQQFMSEEEPLKNEALCSELHEILKQFDDPREIANPLHQDGLTYGYVAITHTHLYDKEGLYKGQVLKGDVLILQFNWDRNIIVTELPLQQNCPIPFLLKDSGILKGLRGVWLPIFDPRRIRGFAERQIQQYVKSVSSLFDEEEVWWNKKIPQQS
jgi:hypothetical protein